MGGFTRPRDLRASNWFPGGPYIQKNKVYESPHEAAYEPHTVFLLESRYRVRHGIGRVDSKDHIVEICRAVDFVKLVRKYNSVRAPGEGRESMDNACWPWLPKSGKALRPTRWWGPDEQLEDIMREIYEDENYSSPHIKEILQDAQDEVDEPDPLSENQKKTPKLIPIERATATDTHPERVNAAATSDSGVSGLNLASSCAELMLAIQGQTGTKRPPPGRPTFDINEVRAGYGARLSTEPFWLPLLAVTFSTRPLALTMGRLSKGLERGLPFYASMSNDDRKCLLSYSNRMTSMRLDRMRKLTLDIISRLAGHMGGFIGIRFNTHQRGRGVSGEGLADPIPADKRIVKVLLGHWFYRAQEEAELYRGYAEEWGGKAAIDLAMMNEWGRRLDENGNEVPLTKEETSTDDVHETEDDEAEDENENEETAEKDVDAREGETTEEALLRNPHLPSIGRKRRLKPELARDTESAAELRKKLAYRLVGKHRSVMGL